MKTQRQKNININKDGHIGLVKDHGGHLVNQTCLEFIDKG